MGMRRTQDVADRHARQHDVVDVAAAAPQQPRILKPRNALTNREFPHAQLLACMSWPAGAGDWIS